MATTTTSITEDGLVLYPEKSSLERLRFFFGQLLTQRDLEAEQRYHLTLQRLTQRETFGTGTVAGLAVEATEVSPLSVFVHPGLAFDPDGRELILEAMECIPVAEASVEGAGVTYDEASYALLATALSSAFGAPITEADLHELEEALQECGLLASGSSLAALEAVLGDITVSTVTLTPPVLLRDYLFDQLVGVTFVGLRYREVGTDPAPAVLDASCCGGVSCFPTRTSQGVYIVSSSDPFPATEDPYTKLRECIDTQLFDQMAAIGDGYPVDPRAALCACLTSTSAWRGLPPTDDVCGTPALPIVPLARVCWRRFDFPDLPNILHVDNCSWRPLAPGVPAIRALIESYMSGQVAAKLLPRVVQISPTENEVFTEGDTIGGFEITARMTSPMDWPSMTTQWELHGYQTDGSYVPYSTPTGPGGSTAVASLEDGDRVFKLAFSSGTGFPPGTYVWRFPSGSPDLTSQPTSQDLDGEPNPPNAVPSGNAAPGGTFEARFVVVAGS